MKSNDRTVVITRSNSGNSKQKKLLLKLGFRVVEVPTIDIKPINIDELKKIILDFDFNYLIFHSQNAIKIFFEEYLKLKNIKDLIDVKIYVVGSATKKSILEFGLNCFCPKEKFTGFELLKLIHEDNNDNKRLFLPHSDLTDENLINGYKDLGEFKHLSVYKSVMPEKTELDEEFNDITFTASSTFKNFIKMYGREFLINKRIYSIGPITSAAIRKEGLKVYKEPRVSTIEALVDCIEED